jgi:hypothetical protein
MTRRRTGASARRATWSTIVLAIAVVAVAPSAPVADALPAQSADVTGARLELVEQRFAVDPNGDIALQYRLIGLTGDPLGLIPPEIPEPPITDATTDPATDPDQVVAPTPAVPEPPSLTLEVTNYTPLDDPDDVARVVGSDVDPDVFGRIGDAVDGVAVDARPLMTRNDDGTVELALTIGTDVTPSVEDRLKLERPGLYPLRIELLLGDRNDDNVVATAGTIVQRVAGGVDADAGVPPPIDLSVITVTPDLSPSADSATAAATRTRLDDSIELAATTDAPVTLEVPPTLIADMAAPPDGADRLATSLADDELVALPIVPLDVSSAVAAGRADAYTRLVRAGEDLLTEAVPTTPSRRDIWITADALSAGGAQHLRDLGTRFVVIPPEVYEATIDDELPPTDLFVAAELPDGGTLPFLVVDALSSQLSAEAADRILDEETATEWSVGTLAVMLVDQATDDADTRADSPTAGLARRSRVLTAPDLSSPDGRLVTALERLASTTPAVRFTAASALTGVTDVDVDADGDPVTVQLPDVAGPPLDARVELLDRTGLEILSAASMIPDDDPRIDDWSTRLDGLISTGYTDAEVDTAVTELAAEADALKQAVVLPEPFTFTLTGRSGTIEVRVGNTLDEPLNVVVGFDSSKVTFPEGDQLVTLRPLDETSVVVPVEAESNGTSSIRLTVATPVGEQLGDPVTLTARVTALTGLGQVLTGGLVLVLLTWWFTHWRSRRRAELADDVRERHPSSRKVESDAL